jgi:hypothetical protein
MGFRLPHYGFGLQHTDFFNPSSSPDRVPTPQHYRLQLPKASNSPKMADRVTDEELQADRTEGFKVGEKKTIDEYHKLGMISPHRPAPS